MHSYLMGLIGDGIRNSLTPPMHEAEARAHGLSLLYRPVDLTELKLKPDAVGRLLRTGAQLGFDAFNVTHPCKQLVIEQLDDMADEAVRIGAVNTVLIDEGKLIGRNTDAIGFSEGLRRALPGARPDLGHVVQMGAGGAGAALADALAGLGTERLSIVDTDSARAAELAERVRRGHGTSAAACTPGDVDGLLAGATGLVNATPVGMHHHPGLPVPPELLRPEMWVADAVYLPFVTELIAAASALGCDTMAGGYMAVGQAAATFRLVTGVEPDIDRMRANFMALAQDQQPAAAQPPEEVTQ